jgi:hypothetical protein
LSYSNSAPLQQAQASNRAESAAETKSKSSEKPSNAGNQSRNLQKASSRPSKSAAAARTPAGKPHALHLPGVTEDVRTLTPPMQTANKLVPTSPGGKPDR